MMKLVHDEILNHLPQGDDARRLFHGRGHCFAGYEDLVVDWYPPVVMVFLYRQRPENWLADFTAMLEEVLPERPQAVLLQERYLPDSPNRLLSGVLPETVDATEDGLVYRLRLGEAQNIGFFPDMKVGRRLVQEMAAGKTVLNLFAYTCSFSVAALAGGAAQVVNLDMNRGALALGRFNHRLNDLDLRQASFMAMELFRSLGRLKKLGPFDLVICDPPASQGKSFTADRHWPKLVRCLPDLVAPGGEVVACLNAPQLGPDYLDGLFSEQVPTAELLGFYRPGEDFPEADPDRGVSLHHYWLP